MALLVGERVAQIACVRFSLVTGGAELTFFRIGWLTVMLLILALFALWLNRRFPNALAVPRSILRKRWSTEIAFLLLLAPWCIEQLLYFLRVHDIFLSAFAAAKGNTQALQQVREAIINAHQIMWDKMGCGTDLLGVILGSLKALLFPILEERFFRGYMINRACQHFRPFEAIGIVAVLFALTHLLVTASLLQLGRFFLMGVFCGIIRLWSGRWHDALWLHLTINWLTLMTPIYTALIRFHLYLH